MKNLNLFSLILIIILSSCKGNSNKSNERAEVQVEQQEVKPLVIPDIPITATEPGQRAEFLALNYWNNFDFSDTIYIHHPEITEQSWVDYLNIIDHAPLNKSREGIAHLMDKAGNNKTVYLYFTNLADKYLYDPNSPYRNEEYYIPVLESMVKSPLLDESEKVRPENRLKMANKNRSGHKAIDFTYTLESGKKGNLYGIATDYILLYFHNPGCQACGEIAMEIKSSPPIQYKLSEKKLTIFTVYPDEDLTEWKRHLDEFPKEWINGYDKGQIIQNKNLYDLKAIPTLYLLDRNKTVLLKDTTVPAINEYLSLN